MLSKGVLGVHEYSFQKPLKLNVLVDMWFMTASLSRVLLFCLWVLFGLLIIGFGFNFI